MNTRVADHPVLPLLLERWSSRAFDGAQTVKPEELATLFEAARWAPSSFNVQPWRFIASTRDSAGWTPMLDLLIPFNRRWAQSAAVLICVCSETDFSSRPGAARQPSYSHSFDAGAAWGLLALQGASMGLLTHAMTGFDTQNARRVLNLPDNIRPEAMVALGRPGNPESLPDDLRARELPSTRVPISAFVFEHTYGNAAL